jgi:hypothetical protein
MARTGIPIGGLLQTGYFWLKNRKRSKIFSAWAQAKGLQFAPNAKGFDAPPNPAAHEDASHVAKHGSRAAGIFLRLIGESKIQTHYMQFAANRFRGDWQSDKNISWGTWNGHTVLVWDTVFYDLNDGDGYSEGEYTSVLILTESPLHRTLITPNTLLKRLGSLGVEEGRGHRGYETVKFELNAFNKAFRVRAHDKKWTFAVIDEAMIEWMLDQKAKHTIEIAPGGIMLSTWFTMSPEQVENQLDFCTGFLEHMPEDLKDHTMDGEPV